MSAKAADPRMVEKILVDFARQATVTVRPMPLEADVVARLTVRSLAALKVTLGMAPIWAVNMLVAVALATVSLCASAAEETAAKAAESAAASKMVFTRIARL